MLISFCAQRGDSWFNRISRCRLVTKTGERLCPKLFVFFSQLLCYRFTCDTSHKNDVFFSLALVAQLMSRIRLTFAVRFTPQIISLTVCAVLWRRILNAFLYRRLISIEGEHIFFLIIPNFFKSVSDLRWRINIIPLINMHICICICIGIFNYHLFQFLASKRSAGSADMLWFRILLHPRYGSSHIWQRELKQIRAIECCVEILGYLCHVYGTWPINVILIANKASFRSLSGPIEDGYVVYALLSSPLTTPLTWIITFHTHTHRLLHRLLLRSRAPSPSTVTKTTKAFCLQIRVRNWDSIYHISGNKNSVTHFLLHFYHFRSHL